MAESAVCLARAGRGAGQRLAGTDAAGAGRHRAGPAGRRRPRRCGEPGATAAAHRHACCRRWPRPCACWAPATGWSASTTTANWPESVQRLPRLGGVDDVQHRADRGAQARPGAAVGHLARDRRGCKAWAYRWWASTSRRWPMCKEPCTRVATVLRRARRGRGLEPHRGRHRQSGARACRPSVRGTTVYFEVGSGRMRPARHRTSANC